MSSCVVWIDKVHAKIFNITAQGVEKLELKHDEVPPIGPRHDNYQHNAEEKFYHNVASSLTTAVEELLIMGPGVAKSHFKSHLENHHHEDLLKKVIAVETLDSVSDNQVLEASRKFFKKAHLFN